MEGHGKVMVPKEPLASIIKEALNGYTSGVFETQAQVTQYFQSQPEFPKNRYGKVTHEATNRILKRITYAGYIDPPKHWGIELRKGKHEGLISLETYEKI